MREVLHDRHIGKATSEALTATSIALFVGTARGWRQHAGENLVQRVDDASFEEDKRDLRASPR